jgi:hypothetical protein
MGFAAAAMPASADPSLSSDGVCPVVGLATDGCNLYISFFDGIIQTTPGASVVSYDAAGDTLIGVLNNTANPISSFNISSYGDIFDFTVNGIDGFEGDGVTATGDNPDTTGYGGPNVYFTAVTGTAGDESGTVNFANGGLLPGGIDYFALVGAPDFTAAPTLNPYVADPLLPEPATLTILGVGMLASGVARRFRRKA